jgi:hypothetical protein
MSQISCSQLTLKQYALLYIAGKGGAGVKDAVPLANLISAGNMKLPSTTGIFNMASATNCPSKKLGLCKASQQHAKCYAMKSEQNHCSKYVLPYREAQKEFWQHISAKEFVSQFILLNSTKVIPFKNLRFNEAGDFHNQAELDKAEEIAKMLRRFGIRCYCYTSRNDLNFSKIKHLLCHGSNFVKNGISNKFRIVKSLKERKMGESVCKQNCRVCKKCLMKNLKIIIKKH